MVSEGAPMKLTDTTLTDLASKLRTREVSAENIAMGFLDMIAENDPALNAFETIDADAVLVAARQADAAAAKGSPLGLLHGLPVAFKANIDVVGYATTGSSRALREYFPKRDAPIVSAMKAQGVVPMGKLNMHELAFGATSNNAYCGAVRNPYNKDHVPGGSSGGSGAAVGGGLLPAALGTDTGGSVRVPAALCGAAGFRPSTGRWSTKGILPISHTRDTAGPIARSVADLDLLDRAVAAPKRAAATVGSLEKRRFGVPRGYFFDTLTDDVAEATERALADLKSSGVELVDIDLPTLWQEIDQDSMLIAVWEFKTNVDIYLAGSGIEYDSLLDQIESPDVAALAASIRALPPETQLNYDEIISLKRPNWQNRMKDLFASKKLDALVYPMVCSTASKIGLDDTFNIGGIELPVFNTLVRNSAVGSALGMPGLALPNGLGQNGLPISLGIDCAVGDDADLMSLGLAIEQVLFRN
jgi:mandelamide amidase